MYPPSHRNRIIGLAGLIWFTYCTGVAVLVPIFREDFRQWSRFTWTDREIAIGAICYFTAGLGGGLLAITRLFLPMFARKACIGDGIAPPLFMIDFVPRFEDFHALQATATARAANFGALLAMLFGLAIFILLVHPEMRHSGMAFQASLIAFGGIVLFRIVSKFVIRRSMATRGWSLLRWNLIAKHREPRRCYVFEDGVLTQGQTFLTRLAWYDVSHAQRLDDAIGLVGRGQWVLLPLSPLSAPMAEQLFRLLESNRVSPVLNTAARRG